MPARCRQTRPQFRAGHRRHAARSICLPSRFSHSAPRAAAEPVAIGLKGLEGRHYIRPRLRDRDALVLRQAVGRAPPRPRTCAATVERYFDRAGLEQAEAWLAESAPPARLGGRSWAGDLAGVHPSTPTSHMPHWFSALPGGEQQGHTGVGHRQPRGSGSANPGRRSMLSARTTSACMRADRQVQAQSRPSTSRQRGVPVRSGSRRRRCRRGCAPPRLAGCPAGASAHGRSGRRSGRGQEADASSRQRRHPSAHDGANTTAASRARIFSSGRLARARRADQRDFGPRELQRDVGESDHPRTPAGGSGSSGSSSISSSSSSSTPTSRSRSSGARRFPERCDRLEGPDARPRDPVEAGGLDGGVRRYRGLAPRSG